MPRRYHDEYDEDEDDRPRRRRPPRRKSKAGGGTALVVGAIIAIAVFIALGGVVAAVMYYRDRAGPGTLASDPSLVAHWSFDDVQGAQVTDQSGRGRHATLVGGRVADGIRGQALWLDGQPNTYCDLGAGPAFDFAPGAPFTLAGWFQTLDRSGTILSFRHTTLPTQVEVIVRNGQLLGIIGDDTDRGNQGIVWGRPVADGRWHHFALVRTAAFVELYLDGVSQGRGAGMHAGPITTDLRAVGCERLWVQQNDMRWGRPGFVGGIDEVYVFNRELSADEVQRLMRR
jgi:hypothetical protein